MADTERVTSTAEICKIVEARKEKMTKELLALEQVKLDKIFLARRGPKNGGSCKTYYNIFNI